MNNTELNEAAEKYAEVNKAIPDDFYVAKLLCKKDFKAGAQWQLEQKQVVGDEEIERLATELLKQKEQQIERLKSARHGRVGDGFSEADLADLISFLELHYGNIIGIDKKYLVNQWLQQRISINK